MKVKLIRYRTGQALGSGWLMFLQFIDIRRKKVVILSALLAGRLYPKETSLLLISVRD